MNRSFRIFWATQLILLISISSFAQIKYQKTIKEALEKASADKMLVFVHAGVSRWIMEMKVSSLSDQPRIANFYNKNFVNYLIPSDSPEFAEYLARYQINSYPALFFLNAEGQLVFRAPRAAMSSDEFIAYGQEALDVFKSGKSLSAYEQKHKAGKLSIEELKDYVQMRIKAGLFDNSELADRYVSSLTVGQLDNYKEVLFILQTGPLAYGKAYKLAYTNLKITDSIYKNEPPQERIDINNRIISNTFNAAVAKKDYNMLNNLNNFIRAIHSANYNVGSEQAMVKSLAFYKAVNDTAKYFSTASYHYDQSYMRQNVDSLRKLALKNQEARDEMRMGIKTSKTLANKKPGRTPPSGKNLTTVVTRRVTISGTNSMTANELNSIAWDFYTMGTRNKNYLTKAMYWSLRSIEIDPDPAYYDTLAHIFYRMGLFDEAILNQNKAIALLMKNPEYKKPLSDARTELVKMQERNL